MLPVMPRWCWPPLADAAHPAFSNLFIETEILQDQHAILCTRRPRSKEEQQPWMFHLMKLNNRKPIEVSYETDRNVLLAGVIHTAAGGDEQ